jgi:EAL domain-containing protein (putative c-di-GMP-specific phosphodiesterase class I)
MAMCTGLSVRVLAEGIETPAERDWLAEQGVELMQGYLFARPALRGIGEVNPAAWA